MRRRALALRDLDHLHDWSHNGHTSAINCHPLCPHHHKMKHETGWTITHRHDGAYIWTAPTGRTYMKEPTQLPH